MRVLLFALKTDMEDGPGVWTSASRIAMLVLVPKLLLLRLARRCCIKGCLDPAAFIEGGVGKSNDSSTAVWIRVYV